MPNWCYNHLSFQGAVEDIRALLQFAKSENNDFDFNAFVPIPDSVFRGNLSEKEEKMYPGELNWYGWSIEHWGTKWNACDVHVYWCNESTVAQVHFTTAWGVPTSVLVAMSEQFPNLLIINEWVIEKIEGAGILKLEAGAILSDAHETSTAFDLCESTFIHQINLKYRAESYLETLAEWYNDEPNNPAYAYYLHEAQLATL